MADKQVLDFLSRVARKPKLLAAFMSDPRGTATRAGLSPATVDKLLSGESSSVALAMGLDLRGGQAGDLHWLPIIVPPGQSAPAASIKSDFPPEGS